MKKVKILVENIKNAILGSTKAKIVTGIVTGLLVTGVTGGIIYYSNLNNEVGPTISRKEVEEGVKKSTVVKKDDKAKEFDDKVVKLNSIVMNIKKLDEKFEPEQVTEENVDSLIEKYTKLNGELVQKKTEEDKKVEEEKTTEVAENTSSSSSAVTPSTSSTPSKSTSTAPSPAPAPTPAPAPAPDPEPTPEPAPIKPSGWRQDIASAIVSRSTTPNTNCTSGENMVMTPSQLSNLNSWAEQWKNGSISGEQFKANAKNDAQSVLDGISPTYLTNIVLDKQVFSGDDSSNMFISGSGHHYLWARAYYDGNSNQTTLYTISGTMSR